MRKSLAALTATVAMGALAFTPAVASATSGPAWEPDPNALGTLTFYDASGHVITSGSNLSHIADYAEASTPDSQGGTRAQLQFANPTPSTDPGNWPVGQASGNTVTPPTSGPLAGAANPVVTLGSNDGSVLAFANGHVENTQSGYVDVYQVRLATSAGGGGSSNNSQYWASDIQINKTSGTWVEIYPTQGTQSQGTTTTLSASPAGSVQQGAQATLTATVTAADGTTHPAGSVEFFQDGQSLGSAGVNTTTGQASLQTSALLPSAPNGTTITATFTPSDSSSFQPSTSSNFTYTVNPTANTPSISGAHKVGTAETCDEGTVPYGVVVTYAWKAAGKTVGTARTIKIPASAVNQTLTCVAGVHDGAGPTDTASSAGVKVLPGALKNTKAPKLSGSAKVGATEKCSSGSWSARASYSYQWLVNRKAIKHATKSSFRIPRSDKGKKLSCRVTAKAAGYTTASATSNSAKVKG